MSVFADLSVHEVQLLARAIGHCSKGHGDEEKEQQVTELLRGLLGPLYPDSLSKTHDERPLHCHYATIVSACSPDFVHELLCQNRSPLLGHLTVHQLLQTQYGVVRRLVLNTVFNGDNRVDKHPEYLQSLLQRVPPALSLETGLSASMSSSLSLLRELGERQMVADFPSELVLPGLAEPLRRQALRKESRRQLYVRSLNLP